MTILVPRRVAPVAKHNGVARRAMSSSTVLTHAGIARLPVSPPPSPHPLYRGCAPVGWQRLHVRAGLEVDDGGRECAGLKNAASRSRLRGQRRERLGWLRLILESLGLILALAPLSFRSTYGADWSDPRPPTASPLTPSSPTTRARSPPPTRGGDDGFRTAAHLPRNFIRRPPPPSSSSSARLRLGPRDCSRRYYVLRSNHLTEHRLPRCLPGGESTAHLCRVILSRREDRGWRNQGGTLSWQPRRRCWSRLGLKLGRSGRGMILKYGRR
jgi:hypothetical protein